MRKRYILAKKVVYENNKFIIILEGMNFILAITVKILLIDKLCIIFNLEICLNFGQFLSKLSKKLSSKRIL